MCRFTLQDIQRHQWYRKDLPPGVAEMNDNLPAPAPGIQVLCSCSISTESGHGDCVDLWIYSKQGACQQGTGPGLVPCQMLAGTRGRNTAQSVFLQALDLALLTVAAGTSWSVRKFGLDTFSMAASRLALALA